MPGGSPLKGIPQGTRKTPTTTLGRNVRQARLARHMSMQALAEAAGIKSLTLIQRIETGPVKNIHASTLYGLAIALGVRMEDLIGVKRVEHAVAGRLLSLRGGNDASGSDGRAASDVA